MLWSYAKLPVAPPAVVFALVHKITDQLVLQSQRPDGASTFDAQVGSSLADVVAWCLPLTICDRSRRQTDVGITCNTGLPLGSYNSATVHIVNAGTVQQHLGPGAPQVPGYGG